MIYISEEQLKQVEYLIEQSIRGNHVLFDPAIVHKIFIKNRPFTDPLPNDQAYAVEHHIERLLQEPTLEAKRVYLDQLDADTYEFVLKTYFNIVENKIFEKLEVRH